MGCIFASTVRGRGERIATPFARVNRTRPSGASLPPAWREMMAECSFLLICSF